MNYRCVILVSEIIIVLAMNIPFFPFETFDWTLIPKEEHLGETGFATSQVLQFENIRVRIVEYSPKYKADHWCKKGHIIYCLEGEMVTELENGTDKKLSKGMMYFVGDNSEAHRTSTSGGCKLFIVD
jgi:hypothetical protein